MGLQIRRLSYSIGAEISGVDLSSPLNDSVFRQIHAAFLEYGILLFRGQTITREQHVAFSRHFGKLEDNSAYPKLRHPDLPEIYLVIEKPGADGNAVQRNKYQGDHWHSDLIYTTTPAAASILHAVLVPDIGGDTMFSNMYLAYETLSAGMKALIENLHCLHIGGSRNYVQQPPPVAQPLVRVHPETGRKVLYLTDHVKEIVGLTADESKPLIQFLCAHAARPQFVYRHAWQKEDLIMWDNRCTWHYALGDHDRTQLRHMERTTVTGTPSGYVYDGRMR